MKVIVCGSRDYALSQKGIEKLNQLHAEYNFTLLIHGDAAGIDLSSGKWARRQNIDVKPFPANWAEYGKSAGPRRNEEMTKWLSENGGGLCIAFYGNRGTANCKENALKCGIPVLDLTNKEYVTPFRE